MTEPFSDRPVSTRTYPALVLLAAMALVIYAHTFKAPFVFDDLLNITRNPAVHMTRLSSEALSRVMAEDRPLAAMSFALNYYFHGLDVTGYRVFNLIIHVVTALIILLVTRQTLYLCGITHGATPFFAAILWLVHPLHTQSVTYIVQRMNAMAVMFYMLALYFFIRARIKAAAGGNPVERVVLYMLCTAAAVLGLAAKQIVVTLPIVLLLYEWFFFQQQRFAWLKERLPWLGLTALVLVVLLFFYLGTHPLDTLSGMYQKHEFTMGRRLLTEAGVVVYYFSLLLFPVPSRLNLVYDYPLSRTPADPLATLVAITALLAVGTAALYAGRKHPLPAFCVLWFLVTLSVESSFLGLALAFEHRTYLPSIFPIIGLVSPVFAGGRPRTRTVGILCIIIMVFSVWTYQRNTVWRSPAILWGDVVRKAPGSALAHHNFGVVLAENKNYNAAIDCYTKALRITPDYASAHYNLGVDLYQTGRPQTAIRHLEAAVKLKPDNMEYLNALGMAHAAAGGMEDAVDSFVRALRLQPDFMLVLNNLGAILTEEENIETTVSRLLASKLTSRQMARVYNSLASTFLKRKNMTAARRYYSKAVAADPSYIEGLYNLGLALALENQYRQAAEVYDRLLAIDPDQEEARRRYVFCLKHLSDQQYSEHP